MLYIHPEECIDCGACVPGVPGGRDLREHRCDPSHQKDLIEANADLPHRRRRHGREGGSARQGARRGARRHHGDPGGRAPGRARQVLALKLLRFQIADFDWDRRHPASSLRSVPAGQLLRSVRRRHRNSPRRARSRTPDFVTLNMPSAALPVKIATCNVNGIRARQAQFSTGPSERTARRRLPAGDQGELRSSAPAEEIIR